MQIDEHIVVCTNRTVRPLRVGDSRVMSGVVFLLRRFLATFKNKLPRRIRVNQAEPKFFFVNKTKADSCSSFFS